MTIDLDATLITAHSDQDGAAGNFEGGFGFAPMMAYLDESSEALAGMLRPGNAGTHSASDQIAAAESALDPIDRSRQSTCRSSRSCCAPIPLVPRTNSWTGAERDGSVSHSVRFDQARQDSDPGFARGCLGSIDREDGKERPNGQSSDRPTRSTPLFFAPRLFLRHSSRASQHPISRAAEDRSRRARE